MQHQVDHEDRTGQDTGDLDKQHREMAQPRLELRLLLALTQPGSNLPELRAQAGGNHHALTITATYDGTHEPA